MVKQTEIYQNIRPHISPERQFLYYSLKFFFRYKTCLVFNTVKLKKMLIYMYSKTSQYIKQCMKRSPIFFFTSNHRIWNTSTGLSYYPWPQPTKYNEIVIWTMNNCRKWKKVTVTLMRIWRYEDAYIVL